MLFSIITINLNNRSGLEKTISSVANQIFKNYEYIIIDGQSSDGSVTLIQESSIVSKFKIEKDNGVYDAMNKGLELATGEYCIFLNSGDCLVDDSVLSEVAKKMDFNSDLYYGCIVWEDKHLPRWNPKRDLLIRNILMHSPIPHQATFYKTKVLRAIGGYKSEYKIISDWGSLIDYLQLKKKIEKLDIDISICELPGVSNVSEKRILKERRNFLYKYHKKLVVLFYIVPIISRVKKMFRNS